MRQAELLAERLAGRKFAAFYTSDLERAAQTAERIAMAIRMAPEPMPALREIFLGEWEGLTTEDIAKRYPEAWAGWVEEPHWDLVPGGEGEAAFEVRVTAALDELTRRHPTGDVLAVTHGGVIQIALHRVIGTPSRGLFPFRIQNVSISVIERRSGRAVISGVNDIAHLEKALVSDVGAG